MKFTWLVPAMKARPPELEKPGRIYLLFIYIVRMQRQTVEPPSLRADRVAQKVDSEEIIY